MGIEVVPIGEDEGALSGVDRYVLSRRVCAERRTGSAFSRGVVDKTLFTGAIYMREHFEVPVLIVEGAIDTAYSAFSPQSIRGALSSMMLVYGVSVLSTAGLEETAALLAMMARQEHVGVPEISLVPKRKATDLADLQRRVVEMLPGCGIVAARDLLQRFGSVERIVGATEQELCTIRGIGAKKASEIRRVLTAEYASVDTERNLEDAIEAEPDLLFATPVELVSRQHYLHGTENDRQIIDLVFWDQGANELILVELKRGRLNNEHEAQLARYLDHVSASPLLCRYLDGGARLSGVLATITECTYRPRDPERITVRIVSRERTIEVLQQLRLQYLDRLSIPRA
jgi:ERCC4-type nuclease